MNQIEVAPGYGTLNTLLRLVKSFQEGLVPRAPAGSPNGGQWVGNDVTTTPEFKAWFGDSKVVDELGKPVVVYHGTSADFDSFSANAESITGHPSSALGFYFTQSQKVAEKFSRMKSDKPFWNPDWSDFSEGARILPVFLSIKNPKVLQAREFTDLFVTPDYSKVRDFKDFHSLKEKYIKDGYDGILIKKTPGGDAYLGNEYIYDQYVAFYPNQIKSAIGNKTFNPKSNKIYNFREELVPRKLKGDPEGGQWTSEWITGGPAFEARAKTMRIPPAWTDVKINKDEDADLLATGTDAKGRKQYIYSQNHHMRQAELKFARNMELIDKAIEIEAENSKNLSSRDKQKAENAAVFALIMSTGIRPGSDSERGADKWAYGATTLEGRHVVEQVKGVRLRFVGKKGVSLDIPITDPEIAKMLVKRKAAAGAKGRLFNVSDSELRDYVKTLDGGNFHPKDFRTLKGTATALEEIRIKKYKKAKNEKEYKKTVKAIAKKVSLVLGNTPSVALKSYINPFVFLKLKP